VLRMSRSGKKEFTGLTHEPPICCLAAAVTIRDVLARADEGMRVERHWRLSRRRIDQGPSRFAGVGSRISHMAAISCLPLYGF
jgi:hypothetical protein